MDAERRVHLRVIVEPAAHAARSARGVVTRVDVLAHLVAKLEVDEERGVLGSAETRDPRPFPQPVDAEGGIGGEARHNRAHPNLHRLVM